MRSENYSDQELVDIWRSWGIKFPPDISLVTAAKTLRLLEKHTEFTLEDKYLFIQQLHEYSGVTLTSWCKKISALLNSKWVSNFYLFEKNPIFQSVNKRLF